MPLSNRSARAVLAVAVLLAVSAFPSAGAAQELPSGREIMDRYLQATGYVDGSSAQHQTRRTVAEMEMPSVGMSLTMEILQARPNLTLTRSEMPGIGLMLAGHDGEVVWSMNAIQGPRVLEGEEREQVLQTATFDQSEMMAKITTMETVGLSTVADRPCYEVRMVSDIVEEVFNCFDIESALLLGSRAPANGEVPAFEMRFEDYRPFDGVLMPTRTRTISAGAEMVLTIRSVSHDPIDPSEFALPAEVRQLLQ
jgi:hypothetical protein